MENLVWSQPENYGKNKLMYSKPVINGLKCYFRLFIQNNDTVLLSYKISGVDKFILHETFISKQEAMNYANDIYNMALQNIYKR